MKNKNKKNKKKKQRVLVNGPVVSDQNVLNKMDNEREKVQREVAAVRARESRIYGHPFDRFDIESTTSAMVDLLESLEMKRKRREATLNNNKKEKS